MFVFFLARALERLPIRLHAVVLMSNHVHMVVTPLEEAVLGRFVHAFAQRYAQYRNRRRAGSGKLFEERYKSILIKDATQLARTTAYVEMNPVRAGIASEPAGYRWSTFALHAGHPKQSRIPAAIWTPSRWYLAMGATAEQRARAYREFVRGYADAPRHAEQIQRLELASARYTRRLERPDRTRAAERSVDYRAARAGP